MLRLAIHLDKNSETKEPTKPNTAQNTSKLDKSNPFAVR
jgi:hypothetical protein